MLNTDNDQNTSRYSLLRSLRKNHQPNIVVFFFNKSVGLKECDQQKLRSQRDKEHTHFLRSNFLWAEFGILCRQELSYSDLLSPRFLCKPCAGPLWLWTPEHTLLWACSCLAYFCSNGSIKHKDWRNLQSIYWQK